MKAYLINMHLLVPRSRSSAKVKVIYKGYVSQKMAVSGGICVSQTNLGVFFVANDKFELMFILQGNLPRYHCKFAHTAAVLKGKG